MSKSQEQGGAPLTGREQPKYRSYVARGKPGEKQLMKNDEVRYRLSETESPVWKINKVIVDEISQEISFELMKTDGHLHPDLAQRDQLTFVKRPLGEEDEEDGKEKEGEKE